MTSSSKAKPSTSSKAKAVTSSKAKPSKAGSSGDAGARGESSGAAAAGSTQQAALHAALARAHAAEARLAAIEKQLSMCRHSFSRAHASNLATFEPPSLAHRTYRSNATSARQACDEAVDHAMRSLRGHEGALYPGLNASSSALAVRLYLRGHDGASRCAELPRAAPSTELEGASEAAASALLLLGVMVCALLNAWSLGYLQPNRHVRRALHLLGCPVPPLVR